MYKKFYEILYGRCNKGHVVLLENARIRCGFFKPDDYAGMEAAAGKLNNMFISVNPMNKAAIQARQKELRKTQPNALPRGNGAEVQTVVALVADVDANKPAREGKTYPSQAVALEAVNNMPVPPTMLVLSGAEDGGFHAYWCVNPIDVTDENREHLGRLSQRWQAELSEQLGEYSLDATSDLCRILRPPGSRRDAHGWKSELLEAHEDRIYDLDELEKLLPAVATPDEAVPVSREEREITLYLRRRNLTVDDLLADAGWTQQSRDRNEWWRPGREDGPRSALTGVSKNGVPGFTVFSGNADPFDCIGRNGSAGKWYNQEAIYVLTRFEGDWGAASRHCLEELVGDMSDRGLAELTAVNSRDELLYVDDWGKFVSWHENRYELALTADVHEAILNTANWLLDDFGELKTVQKKCQTLKSSSKMASGLPVMLKGVRSIVRRPDDFDRDPWLWNCQNGTLNLQTGEFYEPRRSDLLMQVAPFRFNKHATCPEFMKFLRSIMISDTGQSDEDLVAYMQRLLGYCLTGVVTEHILPILYGSGANGKGTLIRLLERVFGRSEGGYAVKANKSLVMAGPQSKHLESVQLFRKRLVSIEETGQGKVLDEATVKQLTGGDTITARRHYENFWSFEPTHKLLLATNHRPQVDGTDHGIWRRLRLIPFNRQIEKADPEIEDRLAKEIPGVFNWLFTGLQEYLTDGLQDPQSVLVATSEYRAEMDQVADWIADHCVLERGVKTPVGELYDSYLSTVYVSRRQGQEPLSKVEFGRELGRKGFATKPVAGVRYRIGIRLRSFEDDQISESSDDIFG